MTNWFTVTLDTIPPTIQVFAPTWTLVTVPIQLRVEMSELPDLGRQEAELIDAQGAHHPVVLTWDGEAWWAKIDTNLLPVGVATVSVTLWDEAGNSSTGSDTVDVRQQAALKGVGAVDARRLNTGRGTRKTVAGTATAAAAAKVQKGSVIAEVAVQRTDAGVSKWQ